MYSASSTPITMRFPSRLMVRTRRPTAADERRRHSPQHERIEARAPRDLLSENPRSKRFDVDGDVGELGHRFSRVRWQLSARRIASAFASWVDRRRLAARVEAEPGDLTLRRERHAEHERFASAAELRRPPVLRFAESFHETLLHDLSFDANLTGQLHERCQSSSAGVLFFFPSAD